MGLEGVTARSGIGIIDPNSGTPLGSADPMFNKVQNELADKGFLAEHLRQFDRVQFLVVQSGFRDRLVLVRADQALVGAKMGTDLERVVALPAMNRPDHP